MKKCQVPGGGFFLTYTVYANQQVSVITSSSLWCWCKKRSCTLRFYKNVVATFQFIRKVHVHTSRPIISSSVHCLLTVAVLVKWLSQYWTHHLTLLQLITYFVTDDRQNEPGNSGQRLHNAQQKLIKSTTT